MCSEARGLIRRSTALHPSEKLDFLDDRRRVVARVETAISAPAGTANWPQPSWRTRSQRELGEAANPAQCQIVEQRERKRWVERLYELILEASMPAVQELTAVRDPSATIGQLAGKRRAPTIRQRVLTWKRVRVWLLVFRCSVLL